MSSHSNETVSVLNGGRSGIKRRLFGHQTGSVSASIRNSPGRGQAESNNLPLHKTYRSTRYNMRKIKNPWVGKEGYNCFGCSPNNPLGVKMEFYEDGEEIVSFWRPQADYQGWIDTMHGGILSTLIDEAAGWVVFRKLQTSGMTTKLEVKYKKAVATNEPQLTIRGRLLCQNRKFADGEVTIENAKGEICCEGKATYYVFDRAKAEEMGFTSCELEGDEMLPM